MSDESLKPTPDESKAAEVKPVEVRQAQVRQGKERLSQGSKGLNANPIVKDETYGGLREENRVVMRHQIALNIDSFRAAPEDFNPRPERTYPLSARGAAAHTGIEQERGDGIPHRRSHRRLLHKSHTSVFIRSDPAQPFSGRPYRVPVGVGSWSESELLERSNVASRSANPKTQGRPTT